MVTKEQFMNFCDNHHIRYNKNNMYLSPNYVIRYKEVNDPNFDKSLLNVMSDTFINVSFKNQYYEETKFLYKPFEKLYHSSKSDDYGWFGYTSYGEILIPVPIHCYITNELRCLFTSDNFSRNIVYATIPFNTIEQLEDLYDKHNQFTKDVKDFLFGDSFQNTIQTYKNNIKIANELIQASEDLLNKTLNIAKRKFDLSEDFKE